MASWEDGGGPIPIFRADEAQYGPYIAGGKRRVSNSDGSDYYSDPGLPHRPCRRMLPVRARPHFAHGLDHGLDYESGPAAVEDVPLNEVTFFIRTCPSSPQSDPGDRADYDAEPSPSPEPEPGPWIAPGAGPGLGPAAIEAVAGPMERTASGISISSDTSGNSFTAPDYSGPPLLDDIEAALQVRRHLEAFTRRSRDTQHERILRTLINPKARVAEFPIDDEALESIFSAANEIFFMGTLSQRVMWDWSHESARQYESQVIGTTALRRSTKLGGYETLIVLSQPILGRDGGYNRRLLISTFLHELIHSYMFVTCGFEARRCGGHTDGFRMIAEMIDEWAGPEYLHLKEMEADLERFREKPPRVHELAWQRGVVDLTRDAALKAGPADHDGWHSSSMPHHHGLHGHAGLYHQHQHHHHHHHHHHHPPQQNHYHHEYVREASYHPYDQGGEWDEWVDDRWDDARWASPDEGPDGGDARHLSASSGSPYVFYNGDQDP